MDPLRCLLPWPSSTFTVADPEAPTGLRVHVEASSLAGHDDPAWLSLADGFSRVTPIVVGFAGRVAPIPVGGPVKLIAAQPGSAEYGSLVPLRFEQQAGATADGGRETLVFGYPLRPLAPASDHVGVVLDDVPVDDPASAAPTRSDLVALGRVAPATQDEAELAAWHAPTRAALAAAHVDPAHVVRVWSFTTRSEEDPLRRLTAMRQAALDAVAHGQTTVAIDGAELAPSTGIAMIVRGRLGGLPQFVKPGANTTLAIGPDGLAIADGTRETPFRIVVPAGSGAWPFMMYGHGTGGSYDDPTLDDVFAAGGAGKIGVQLDGWTGADVIDTFVGLSSVMIGAHHAAAMLEQALADASAVEASLSGALGDALAADTIAGQPNPAAGRHPDASQVLWVGGSLGGTMGLVASAAEPHVKAGVLNVPGAAWTHFIPYSKVFDAVRAVLRGPYHGDVDLLHALAMSQGIWDEVDGAAWSSRLEGRGAAFLVQEVLGDPILPNAGSEMVAHVTQATQVGASLAPLPAPLPTADEVDGASGFTQFAVSDTGAYDIHGFAAADTPAGRAARGQIEAFVRSVRDGAPVIRAPEGCPKGSCDFRAEP